MVITIDGPAGSGKSTVSRRLAERIGFEFLDTGAMYRAVAYAGWRENVDWRDAQAVKALLDGLKIDFQGPSVFLNGCDVSREIRTSEVTSRIHWAADHPTVREFLSSAQRRLADGRRIVTEGRDQGTDVFPDALCKIFLTATAEERARRRHEELRRQGEAIDFNVVLAQQEARDQRDANRDIGRLQAAEDAVAVETDGLSIDQVVDQLEILVRDRIEKQQAKSPGA